VRPKDLAEASPALAKLVRLLPRLRDFCEIDDEVPAWMSRYYSSAIALATCADELGGGADLARLGADRRRPGLDEPHVGAALAPGFRAIRREVGLRAGHYADKISLVYLPTAPAVDAKRST